MAVSMIPPHWPRPVKRLIEETIYTMDRPRNLSAQKFYQERILKKCSKQERPSAATVLALVCATHADNQLVERLGSALKRFDMDFLVDFALVSFMNDGRFVYDKLKSPPGDEDEVFAIEEEEEAQPSTPGKPQEKDEVRASKLAKLGATIRQVLNRRHKITKLKQRLYKIERGRSIRRQCTPEQKKIQAVELSNLRQALGEVRRAEGKFYKLQKKLEKVYRSGHGLGYPKPKRSREPTRRSMRIREKVTLAQTIKPDVFG